MYVAELCEQVRLTWSVRRLGDLDDLVRDDQTVAGELLDSHDPVLSPSTHILVLSWYTYSHGIKAGCIRVRDLVDLWGGHISGYRTSSVQSSSDFRQDLVIYC